MPNMFTRPRDERTPGPYVRPIDRRSKSPIRSRIRWLANVFVKAASVADMRTGSMSADLCGSMYRPNEKRFVEAAWALKLQAFSVDDMRRTVRFLCGALMACGAHVWSSALDSADVAEMTFEFPRAASVEIYSVLQMTGLELSHDSHVVLSALCQCTKELIDSVGEDMVDGELIICARSAKSHSPRTAPWNMS